MRWAGPNVSSVAGSRAPQPQAATVDLNVDKCSLAHKSIDFLTKRTSPDRCIGGLGCTPHRRPASPSLLLPEGCYMRHVVLAMPGIESEQLVNGHLTKLRMKQPTIPLWSLKPLPEVHPPIVKPLD